MLLRNIIPSFVPAGSLPREALAGGQCSLSALETGRSQASRASPAWDWTRVLEGQQFALRRIIDMAGLTTKLMRSSFMLVGPMFLGLTGGDSSSAQVVASPRSGTLAAHMQLDASFSPWCARHSYLCASQPCARTSQACPTSDLTQGKQSFRLSTHSHRLTFMSSRSL